MKQKRVPRTRRALLFLITRIREPPRDLSNTKQNTLLQFVINAIITFFQDVKRTICDMFFNKWQKK